MNNVILNFRQKKISDGIFKDVLWKICKKKPVNSPITRSICDSSKISLLNTLHFVPTNVFWLIVFDLSEEWYMVSLNQSFKCLPEGHYINESSLRHELPHDFPKSHFLFDLRLHKSLRVLQLFHNKSWTSTIL